MPSVRIAVAVAIALVLGFAGIVRGGREAPAAVTAGKPGIEVDPTDRLLFGLQLNWSPALGSLVVANVRANPAAHAERLLAILDDEGNPCRAEAIELAASLPLPAARPAIVRIAQSGEERLVRLAILAANRLKPWTPAELIDFLRRGRRDHVLAALDLAPAAITAVLPEILPFLEHADSRVRGAALRAIPREIDAGLRAQLVARARAAGPGATSLLLALGRLQMTSEIEHTLIDHLEAPDRSMRLAALQALSGKGACLKTPSLVAAMAADPGRDLGERAAALYCLERTRSLGLQTTLPDPNVVHPYLSYFLARCLITMGDRSGIALLLGLVETPRERFDGATPVQADTVLLESRRLLAQLSMTRPAAPLATWKEWFAGLDVLWPTRLDPLRIEF